MDESRTRKVIDHNIVVEKDIPQQFDDKNQNYGWIFKLMKCVTYEIDYNFAYVEPQ